MPSPAALDTTRWWECPSCGHQARTTLAGVLTPMHPCARMAGLQVPLVQVTHNRGIRAGDVRHVAVERQDWIGQDVGVRRDSDGRAVMAVVTERADGSNDCHVFAPIATLTAT